jgi:carboxylate-amine ligase
MAPARPRDQIQVMSQLGSKADVRDHRFGAGAPYTVGIEEEYMLLDPRTLDLAPQAERLLAAEAGGEYAGRVSPELFDSLVEFHTSVCPDVASAGAELRRLRGHALTAAAQQGLRLGSAGTHPFSLFERQRIMNRDRYHALIDELQYAGRRELIYGLHVHVAVPDPERAIAVVNALGAHLCELVALSANSPLWRGTPTGFASSRHMIFAGFPRSGPPPRFRDYEEYASIVEQLAAAGVLEDYTRIWWDVRPHPRFGTVEVRVMDAVSRLEDAIALAAYVRALVHRAVETDTPPAHPVLAHENKWRAARYGLDAVIVDGDRGAATVRAVIARTLAELRPFGSPELEGVQAILRDGNGSGRQLRAFAAGGPRAAAEAIAEATELS